MRFLGGVFLMRLFLFQIHETIESINQLKIQRDFMLSFSRDPKGYIQDWLKSQSRDLKVQYCYLYASTLISFRNLVTLKTAHCLGCDIYTFWMLGMENEMQEAHP